MQLFIIIFLSVSCNKEMPKLQQGSWRATLHVKDNKVLPFTVTVHENGTLSLQNDTERILVDEIRRYGDSIRIQAPVFEGVFKGVVAKDGKRITGDFIKPSLNRIVPFSMQYGETVRFPIDNADATPIDISGNWETLFSPDSDADRYVAKGIFKQHRKQQLRELLEPLPGIIVISKVLLMGIN